MGVDIKVLANEYGSEKENRKAFAHPPFLALVFFSIVTALINNQVFQPVTLDDWRDQQLLYWAMNCQQFLFSSRRMSVHACKCSCPSLPE